MSDQHGKPIVPRLEDDSEPEGADAESDAPDPAAARQPAAGEPVVPRYWTIADQDPVASRQEPTASAEGVTPESVIVITPDDVVNLPDADDEDQQVSAEVPAEVAAEVHAETLAAVPAETLAEVPAETPAEVPAEVPGEMVAEMAENDQNTTVLVSFADDTRWREIMISFVDDPRASVEAAAVLVADEITAYVDLLRRRQESMSGQWLDSHDTEALRIALRSYRDFRKQFADVGTALLRETT